MKKATTSHQMMTAEQKEKLTRVVNKVIAIILTAIIIISGVTFASAMFDRFYQTSVLTTAIDAIENEALQDGVESFFELNHQFVNWVGTSARAHCPWNDRNPDTYAIETYRHNMGVTASLQEELEVEIRNK